MTDQERVPEGREETEPGTAEVPHPHWLGHPALLLGIVVVLAIVAIVGIPRSHGTTSTGVKLQPTGESGLVFTGNIVLPKGTKCVLVWIPGSGGGSAQFNCADGPTLVPASPISAPAVGFSECTNYLKTKQGQLWTCNDNPSSSSLSAVAKTKLPTVKTATMSTGMDWSSWIGSGAGALGALAALGAFLVSLKHH
jgi:hypothetical protein